MAFHLKKYGRNDWSMQRCDLILHKPMDLAIYRAGHAVRFLPRQHDQRSASFPRPGLWQLGGRTGEYEARRSPGRRFPGQMRECSVAIF